MALCVTDGFSSLELSSDLSTFQRVSLIGHSMGGHGALSLYLKSKPGVYKSSSAFAPISCVMSERERESARR